MVEYADDVLSCSPTITTDDGTACWFPGCHLFINGHLCSFHGVQSSWYWSSSSYVPDPSAAWDVGLDGIRAAHGSKGFNFYVWPVRGGQ